VKNPVIVKPLIIMIGYRQRNKKVNIQSEIGNGIPFGAKVVFIVG
jgi:hypothetical protein